MTEGGGMRYSRGTFLLCCAIGLSWACGDESSPTQPDTPELSPTLSATAGSWTSKAPMSRGRFWHQVGATNNGLIYAFGGQRAEDPEGIVRAVEVYNPATNTWSTRGDSPGASAQVNGIGLIAGKFYLPGGGGETGNGFERNRKLWIYTPFGDKWTLGADLPQESSEGVSGVINGKLYVLTGWDNLEDGCPDCGPPVSTRRLFRYNPATNAWVSERSAPNFHVSGAAGVINGKFYVAGGSNNNKLDIYDPATNRWTSGHAMPKAISEVTGIVLAGKLYVMGGDAGEVFAYSPATDRWSVQPSMPTPRRFPGLARVVIDGTSRIFAIGGTNRNETATGKENEMFTP
jgi:N-acetylneuraminic acid mutarotase